MLVSTTSGHGLTSRDPAHGRPSLPLACNRIDHYTLIVPNAKEVADFHERVLGYRLINTIFVNAGSVADGSYDMLNYVMSWPEDKQRVLVITEGLTEESIFHQFMVKYGQGIHHIAFDVENIDEAFELLLGQGVQLTSDTILRDPLTGLKQFFIASDHTGIFIELIERKSDTDDRTIEQQGFFTHNNMAGLAGTMQSYLDNDQVEHGWVKELDSASYFENASAMKVDGVDHLKLQVPVVENAIAFFVNTLGFEQRGSTVFSPKEPDKWLQLERSNGEVGGALPARLTLAATDQIHNRSVLSSLGLDFTEQDHALHLDERYVGYPLTLMHS